MALASLPDALWLTTCGVAALSVATNFIMTLTLQPAKRLAVGRAVMIVAFAMLVAIVCGIVPIPQSAGHARGDREDTLAHSARLAVAGLNAAGLAAACGWSVIVLVGAKRLRRLAHFPSAALRDAIAACHAGRPVRTRLLVSDRLARPAIVGFFRPTILVPAAFEKASPTIQHLALSHELAHLARRDHRWAWLAAVANAFWFYLPPMWWIRAQSRVDAETLTDLRCAESLGSAARYASALIDAAQQFAEVEPTRPNWTPAEQSLTPKAPLTLRVQLLLRAPFAIEHSAPRAWVGGLFVLGLVAATSIVRWSDAVAHSPASSESRGASDANPQWCLQSLAVQGPDSVPVNDAEACVIEGLPERFELSFAVQPPCRGLTVFGQVLALDESRDSAVAVRLICDGGTVEIWIDGVCVKRRQPLPADPSTLYVAAPPRSTVTLQNVELRAVSPP